MVFFPPINIRNLETIIYSSDKLQFPAGLVQKGLSSSPQMRFQCIARVSQTILSSSLELTKSVLHHGLQNLLANKYQLNAYILMLYMCQYKYRQKSHIWYTHICGHNLGGSWKSSRKWKPLLFALRCHLGPHHQSPQLACMALMPISLGCPSSNLMDSWLLFSSVKTAVDPLNSLPTRI